MFGLRVCSCLLVRPCIRMCAAVGCRASGGLNTRAGTAVVLKQQYSLQVQLMHEEIVELCVRQVNEGR